MKIESRDAVFALAFDGKAAPVTSNVLSVAWTSEVLGVLRQIRKEATDRAKEQDEDAFINLPYADLRARIVLLESRWASLRDDVGLRMLPETSEDPQPWGHLSGADATSSLAALSNAFAQWSEGLLAKYSEGRGAYAIGIGRLREFAKEGKILRLKPSRVQLFPWATDRKAAGMPTPFDVSAGFLASKLAGKEIFPGLGPVVRIMGGAESNSAELMTVPYFASGGRYSLVCEISIETLPGATRPLVYLRFKRRRWASAMAAYPSGSSIGGFVIAHASRPHSAFRFTLVRRDGKWVTDLGYLHFEHELQLAPGYDDERVLSYPCDSHASVLVMVKADVAEAAKSDLKAGVPLVDQADAFGRIAEELAAIGLCPFVDFEVAKVPKVQAKVLSLLKAEVTLSRLLERFEEDEPAQTTEQRLEAATGSPSDRWFRDKVPAPEAKHEAIVAAIRKLVGETAYASDPQRNTIYLLTSTPEDIAWIKTTAQAILGDAIKVVSVALPSQTHGPEIQLPDAGKKRRVRFEARVRAWESFLGEQRLPARSMLLVQAPMLYSVEGGKRKMDDSVNKAAARKALAAAGCNVQYLLPSDGGRVDKFLPRVQAAILDLVFGHGGLVWGLKESCEAVFEDVGARPRWIGAVGSLQVQTEWRATATVLVATRLECATGKSWVRFAHQEALPVQTDWMPFDEGGRYLASRRLDLPRKLDDKRALFAGFLSDTLDKMKSQDPHAIMFVDSTRTARWARWLADAGINGGTLEIAPGVLFQERWPTLRLLRIRAQAPSIGQEKLRENEDGGGGEAIRTWTTTQKLFRVGGVSAPTFWSLAKPTTHHKRGASCYREVRLPNSKRTEEHPGPTRMYPAQPEDQHSTPRAVEVVVLQRQPQDEDAQLAAFAQSLRAGMLTAGNEKWVSTPSPLQIIEKLAQYMRA